MKIKIQTDYAISILTYLAKKHTKIQGREIATVLGVAETYMPRITRRLRDEGWITSEPGNVGGYRICVDPKKIRLLDVMIAMEDEPEIERQSDGDFYSHPAHEVLRSFQSVARWYFSSITICDLLNEKKHQLWEQNW